jgi:hypothetical protein
MADTASVLASPWPVLTATAGLIAFHIGLYTLVGRERKSPYVINAIFPVFLLCIVAATIALLTLLLPTAAASLLLTASVCILTGAFGLSFFVVYRTTIRFMYFVDNMSFRHLPVIRQVRRWLESGPKPTYSHDPLAISDEFKAELIDVLSSDSVELSDDQKKSPLHSIALQISEQRKTDAVLAKLSAAFLERGYFVQYVSASRHPIEFVEYFRSVSEIKPPEDVSGNKQILEKKAWQDLAKNLIVIDAYSPHFAFIDSIYAKKDRDLDALGVVRVTSTMTYAGIHSASSKAFNLFKELGDITRKPTLVIYEGTYALTDLESAEQYRIFVRHVIPSEKMWGGMLTVFLEAALNTTDWELLRAYSSVAYKLEATGKMR